MSVRRTPVKVVVRQERSTSGDNLRDKYGGVSGSFLLEGELLRPVHDTRHEVVALAMHPTASVVNLPFTRALAKHGLHVCVANSRFANNDSALVVEKCVLDVGHFVRHLKHVLGYSRVILIGWSGGGALMTLYQSQATTPSISRTPTGDRVDMKKAKLLKADMLILVAAHTGRAAFLAESLDPTVWLTSRNAKEDARPELQGLCLYGAQAQKAPFAPEFLAQYRAAQRSRMERITAWARGVDPDTAFVVEGTMADPRWLDLTMDPNERGAAGNCFLGECSAANDMPTGLARFCTARGWLSQWACGVSQMDAVKHLNHTKVPTLVVVNGADDGVPSSHGKAMYSAITHARKRYVEIPGATHYYITPASDGLAPSVQDDEMGVAVKEVLQFVNEHSGVSLERLQSVYGAESFPPPSAASAEASTPTTAGIRGPAKGFNHLALVCSDMNATVKFYGDVLGMPVIKTIAFPDGGQHFFLDCGDPNGGSLAFFWWPDIRPHAPGIASASKAEMARGVQPRSASGSMNHIAFGIAEQDIPAFRKRIQSHGVWVSPPVLHAENAAGYAFDRNDPHVIVVSVYLWGPDGELIEFAAATDRMFPPDVKERVLHSPGFLKLPYKQKKLSSKL